MFKRPPEMPFDVYQAIRREENNQIKEYLKGRYFHVSARLVDTPKGRLTLKGDTFKYEIPIDKRRRGHRRRTQQAQ
jgi:hypothetical protein